MPEKILDNDIISNFQQYLFDDEEIVWEGKPNPKFSIVFLEGTSGFDGFSTFGSIKLIGWMFGIIVLIAIGLFTKGFVIGAIVAILFGVYLFFLPDILKNKRKKHTKYAITKNRAMFKLWFRGKESVHFVDFADIAKLSCNIYPDKRGTIHFMMNQNTDFKTYDFVSGKKRFYPTFEMIPDAPEVRDMIEKFRRGL